MHGIEPRPAKAGDRGEDVGVSEIGLCVLREIAAERLDPLALDPGDRDAGVREPVCDGKPAHTGRLHHRLYDVVLAEPGHSTRDEGVERRGIVAEAQRSAEGSAVLEDLGDMLAADGEVNADGSGCHREDPSGRSNRTPTAQSGGSSAAAAAEMAAPQSCHSCPVGVAGSDQLRHGQETIRGSLRVFEPEPAWSAPTA